MRKTKIICTIGPATESIEMLEKMASAGMNIARLNMSHGDHASHAKIIKSIQALNKKLDHPVAILLDTQGPEIRTGDMVDDLHLNEGDTISIVARGAENVEESSIHTNYDDLITDVNIGDTITVDNGLINLEVLAKQDRVMQVKVIDGGLLKSKRHVNLPGIRVNLPAITEKDRRDIEFGTEQGVDFIALSFVREASDILQLRELLGDKSEEIKVIAKLEDQEAITNMVEIIEAADGIMVARGDLGVLATCLGPAQCTRVPVSSQVADYLTLDQVYLGCPGGGGVCRLHLPRSGSGARIRPRPEAHHLYPHRLSR